jgi:hypothetical protein
MTRIIRREVPFSKARRSPSRLGARESKNLLVPTALDNGQRSPRKLLAAVVRRLVVALKPT